MAFVADENHDRKIYVSVSSSKIRYAPYHLFYLTDSGSQEDKFLNFSCLISDEQC